MLVRKITVTSVLMLSIVAGVARSQTGSSDDAILVQVAEFHGAAGVFAVEGYRLGIRALHDLGEPRGSFSLDVTHYTPFQVQWSCVADGVQAATGVSAGKLNLHLVETTRDHFETVVWDKRSGKVLHFRIQPEFLTKYLDTPRERQVIGAREVLKLPDSAIFTVRESEKTP